MANTNPPSKKRGLVQPKVDLIFCGQSMKALAHRVDHVLVDKREEGKSNGADFIIQIPTTGKKVYIVWADETEVCDMGAVARRILALRDSISLKATSSTGTFVYILMTRTIGNRKEYSETQLELVSTGVVGGVESFGKVIEVGSDMSDVVMWLKRLVAVLANSIPGDDDLNHPRSLSKKKDLASEKPARSWDERALSSIEKAVGGMGRVTARKVLEDCGSLRQVGETTVTTHEMRGLSQAQAMAIRRFVDTKL
mmetsp:Transcript_59587/g.116905  ORF Transcript_59587/g.116905 Transcript_59587/m.116905 type:complete len:253 (+) Transcript_59587:95-853(+)